MIAFLGVVAEWLVLRMIISFLVLWLGLQGRVEMVLWLAIVVEAWVVLFVGLGVSF